MTKSKKPTTIKEWEKTCENLDKALHSMMQDSAMDTITIENLHEQIDRLETRLKMSDGVIRYLEIQLAKSKPNPV
jgi:ribosomal protein S6